MNLNHVFICGRLTRDPELKSTQAGQSVCSFSLATNRTWTDKQGKKQQDTEFHNCVAWAKTAELICQYMKKGNELLVEGRLQTREWEAKDGSKRKTTEIVVESMQFGARPQGGAPREEEDQKPPREVPTIDLDESPEIKPEDIPF